MPNIIAPSILSADFASLGQEIQAVSSAGADWIHLDVMDGRFVPNITFGPPVVAAAKKVSPIPLDVHLMIVEPDRYLGQFASAGADTLTVHAEACPHLQRTLAEIRRLGCKAGVALNPATPPEAIRFVLDDIDMVLIMSVNPGFGGQSFIGSALSKLKQVRALLTESGHANTLIQVDGGVCAQNAGQLAANGCDVYVAGTAVFGAADYRSAIDAIRSAAKSA